MITFDTAHASTEDLKPERQARRRAASGVVLIFIVLIGSSGITYTRNAVWRDEAALSADVVAKSPLKDRGRYNLGNEYKKIGALEKAIAEYSRAINLGGSPSDVSDAYNNLGRVYSQQGLVDRAIDAYQKAIAFNPHHSMAQNNLGLAYVEMNLLDNAIIEFNNAIRNDPGYTKAHFNLQRVLREKELRGKATRKLPAAHSQVRNGSD